MGALTHESLVEYLIEEAYEVVDSIEAGTEDELAGELGDVLLQVVLHARLAEENGRFDFDDVARAITAKMIRRNPHVFRPDGTLQDSFPATVEEIEQKWDAVKKAEKPERSDPFEGIPPHLPALSLAQKSLDRAERAGFRQAQSPVAPVVELVETGSRPAQSPVAPVVELVETGSRPAQSPVVPAVEPVETASEEELGDYLLAVVAAARSRGFDAERALRGAVRRYQDRGNADPQGGPGETVP
ncbi:MazG nucleotide pyrophosphohydrolase domain-containing protein [Arthrobacter sp. SW1]|uniref:MazG nucleotide pyrophosphohydrolase domain-containing protein n=1 Tax=Arthrobacter sp. SW1 TaxID=1920889 RepID=UPI0009F563BD|nr:MazG nucleotide pyrophosphohydrolase domain-containing protein [Arthrobacter sp. SW1]